MNLLFSILDVRGAARAGRFPAAMLLLVVSGVAPRAAAEEGVPYVEAVRPVLEHYCFECHGERMKGDLDLRPYQDLEAVMADRPVFERLFNALRTGEMPPSRRPQPGAAEKQQVLDWLQEHLFPLDCENPDPGRVTLRRLNRAEYNRTIRDLLGVDFRPADDFPADDAGYGFDNIGDVLTLPPVLFEKYLAAAEKIVAAAVVEDPSALAPDTPLPEGHRRIFFRPVGSDPPAVAAREILQRFASRAYRRPVAPAELQRLVDLFELAAVEGTSFEAALKLPLQAVLVSPNFLFRGEAQPDPDDPHRVHPVDEFALATRLSYFLWSSLPDEELYVLAEAGRLRHEWEAQVRRLLGDPRAEALVENFAGQWLQLRNLGIVRPDAQVFPDFDEALRDAMRRETELFFEHLLREDGRVLDFLAADYTYANERLARHYGLSGVSGEEFRRVSLAGTPRGGVFTHGSVLTLTSNPTRTSPVKRGKWVLDNLLGSPPPPPPPDVPELEAQGALTGTLRERLEQHRQNPNCISCHERMDPIGFGLEHFDGIGAWRETDGGAAIDAAGQLVSGESFAGAVELRQILVDHHAEEFLRCLASKLLIYALGRGLEYYDRCAVDRIVADVVAADYRFSELILAVTRSVPFQMRRGDGDPLAAREARNR